MSRSSASRPAGPYLDQRIETVEPEDTTAMVAEWQDKFARGEAGYTTASPAVVERARRDAEKIRRRR